MYTPPLTLMSCPVMYVWQLSVLERLLHASGLAEFETIPEASRGDPG
jgi:hypothetical protein